MNKMEELLKNSAENTIENNLDGIYEGECEVLPCNAAILVKPYDVNPYRKIDTTASGLIIGVESDKTYKSNETGEVEMNREVVKCGKVIAVGDACKSVQVGDDVYFTTYNMIPIPFRKQGLVIVSETLVMCRIVRK
ncbi:MAG: hypothetical protein J6X03_02065 [Bacilli bacterium]|nr:hypothetical protein [Bacilli bacterium]